MMDVKLQTPPRWEGELTKDLHASIIDLIDKTLACISGMSYGDALEEIKKRLSVKK